jgi:hypothetical protein
MGGVFSSNSTVNQNTQIALNNITQKSSAACSATCEQIQSGNVVFVNGSTTGNITFNQQCTVDATCQITNSIEAAAQAVQAAIQQGSASPSFFIGIATINKAKNVTFQEVQNDITQAIDSTCNNSATQVQTNNLVYAYNSTTGNVGFTQTTDVQSQCVLNNLAQGTATSTQKSDQVANAGGLGSIIILIIIIIVVIIIVIVVVTVISKQNKKNQQQQEGQSSGSSGGGGSGGGGGSSSPPLIIPA